VTVPALCGSQALTRGPQGVSTPSAPVSGLTLATIDMRPDRAPLHVPASDIPCLATCNWWTVLVEWEPARTELEATGIAVPTMQITEVEWVLRMIVWWEDDSVEAVVVVGFNALSYHSAGRTEENYVIANEGVRWPIRDANTHPHSHLILAGLGGRLNERTSGNICI
jgi:hypothetical protein